MTCEAFDAKGISTSFQTKRPLLAQKKKTNTNKMGSRSSRNGRLIRAYTGGPDKKCQRHLGNTLSSAFIIWRSMLHPLPLDPVFISCIYGTEEFLKLQLRATQAPSVNCPVSIEWGKNPAAVSLHVTW